LIAEDVTKGSEGKRKDLRHVRGEGTVGKGFKKCYQNSRHVKDKDSKKNILEPQKEPNGKKRGQWEEKSRGIGGKKCTTE